MSSVREVSVCQGVTYTVTRQRCSVALTPKLCFFPDWQRVGKLIVIIIIIIIILLL